MNARIVVVGIEYDENLGMIARAMKNFGLSELWLVGPKAKKDSFLSRQRAMHATDVLEGARTVKTLSEALKGTSLAIAATARVSKAKQTRLALSPRTAFGRIPANAKIAIVLGRESSGLTNAEIEKCDLLVKIPSSRNYESLNVAIAGGILFYELAGAMKKPRGRKSRGLSAETRDSLAKSFCSIVDTEEKIQNPAFVKNSFRSMVGRSFLAEREARAILAIISRCERWIQAKKAKRNRKGREKTQ